MSKCVWTREPDSDTYASSCGNDGFYFTEGEKVEETGFEFCPYCGKNIEANEPEEEDE